MYKDNEIPKDHLAGWICKHKDPWKRYIDENYRKKWNEYYRLWKGIHISGDENYQSERSKIITPALSQAIESAVAEVEEATFGEKYWFDIEDDYAQDHPEYFMQIRNQLRCDLERHRCRQAIIESILNGAIFGTLLGKVVVEEGSLRTITDRATVVGDTVVNIDPDVREENEVRVSLIPIDPREFIADPSATCIEEMLGCVHETLIPSHVAVERYGEFELGAYSWDQHAGEMGLGTPERLEDYTKLSEWHGKVPKEYLSDSMGEKEAEELESELQEADAAKADGREANYTDYVEAIVTIANDHTAVKSRENPFLMGDRAIISAQWDTVPNRFWGRGIAEKGYHPQKALDAETRGRIDAMALQIRPMLAMNSTMLPRGFKLDVKAGRSIAVNGDPGAFAARLGFGDVSQSTFHQSGELERMVQMGTGAMDSATPTSISPRNSTVGGMSIMQSGMIKRQKRVVRNIGWDFIAPFIEKSLWRYQQFDPQRYPPVDMKFKAMSTLGIMARELENQSITNLLQTTQPGTPGWWLLLRSIYQNSSLKDKDKLVEIAEQQYTDAMNPEPSPQEQQMMQLQMQKAQLELQKIKSEILENEANAQSMVMNAKQPGQATEQINAMVAKYKADKDAQVKVYQADTKAKADRDVAIINSMKRNE
jgi:hypothetical protein